LFRLHTPRRNNGATDGGLHGTRIDGLARVPGVRFAARNGPSSALLAMRFSVASIRKNNSGTYLVLFRFGAKQYQRSLGTTSVKEARGTCARVEETIRLVETGRLVVPEGVCPADFILSDGRLLGATGRARPFREQLGGGVPFQCV